MKEVQLRKWHRNVGITAGVFIFLQALTGVVLTIEDLLGAYWGGIVHSIHRQYGLPGHIYRLVSGIGLIFMVVTGLWLWSMVHSRMSKRQK
ncbi:MAG: hypothetical protein JXB48_09800 [Candidatus Latescibacteria bacterium]|nr:hypothetical protein [Candidatus Latescibacterota bacterium]